MPRINRDEIWGKEGNPGPGAPADFEIPFDSDNIELDSSGNANVPIKIYNDQKNDGDNIFLLTINEPTNPASGFSQEIYEFKEADGIPLSADGSAQLSNDKGFGIGLTTKSSIQTAYVVILDDEKPSRKTQGDSQNNTINLKGVNNNDTSDDTVYAGAGDDTVDAGQGDDIVLGQQGNDIIRGQEGKDALFGGDGNDTLDGGADNDKIYGESGNDYLIGGDGNDYLDGGFGADTLQGGTGNDIYVVDNTGDKIIDSPGTGIETVQASVDWTLSSGLDNLNLIGSAIKGIGNNLNNKIEGNDKNNYLNGAEGDDKLDGSSGDDTLVGGDGNDILDGGWGADTLEGGTGNDIYIVDDLNDKIIDSPGTGIETVKAKISWTLGSGLDNLNLNQYADGFADSDKSNLNGTGNNLNNTITGNGGDNILTGLEGNDTLNGGSGNDTLIGGAGNNTLTGGIGADKFVFNSKFEGIDIIQDFNRSEGDKIQIFSGFGAISTNQFIYNSSTGALSFDASPFDSVAAIQFASLKPGTSFIASSDIIF
ncbi:MULTISPECIES: calcium-binding protein [Nostocales]|uniref:Calcium-binding protein n=3 Tax=Nostocales TaxID=1161 RepID=A0A8S9T5Y1_9CYAN|nr:calcium-binding protein [Tolypothrix bouteillei]KAF3886929.1 calcium-binding protein [Tolypothrix bouteillei VB521301]